MCFFNGPTVKVKQITVGLKQRRSCRSKQERKRPLGHSSINLSINTNLLHCYWKEKHWFPWGRLLPSLSGQIPVSQAWGNCTRSLGVGVGGLPSLSHFYSVITSFPAQASKRLQPQRVKCELICGGLLWMCFMHVAEELLTTHEEFTYSQRVHGLS